MYILHPDHRYAQPLIIYCTYNRSTFRPFGDGSLERQNLHESITGSYYGNSEIPTPNQLVNMRLTIKDDYNLEDKERDSSILQC
jgi:hypothetical protein